MVTLPSGSRVHWRPKACPRCQGDLNDDKTVEYFDDLGVKHIQHVWSCLQCGYEQPPIKLNTEDKRLSEEAQRLINTSHPGGKRHTFKETEFDQKVSQISNRQLKMDGKIYKRE